MSWDEIKDEKEGYVRVRKSEDRALIGRLRKANDDPDAKGYIELKVDDLGFEGGGGPHTHNNYALTGHTHDEYLTDLPDHSHPEYEGGTGGEGYDDTELLKRLEQDEAVIDDHDKRLDADERDISKNRQKIDNIQDSINLLNNSMSGKADTDHSHEFVGGAEYDDSEVRDLIQGNADAIAEIQTKGYDDTELRGLVDGKADEGHTHDVAEHDHDDAYADKTTTNQILNAMAGDIGSLETKTYNNQEAIKSKADSDHTHDAPDLTHEHEGMVTSASVVSIVRLSQAEFDALTDKDSSTLYLVV
jgi:hypothetical protein